jgi:hypothetical protein
MRSAFWLKSRLGGEIYASTSDEADEVPGGTDLPIASSETDP